MDADWLAGLIVYEQVIEGFGDYWFAVPQFEYGPRC